MKSFITIICFVLSAAAAEFAVAADTASLPRVLILGDTVYSEPTKQIVKQLQGQAEVVGKNAGDTASAMVRIEELIGDRRWDVIHFNFGLADLLYKDPKSKAIRALSVQAGGVSATTPEQYEKNLRELLKRLQATKAKLIWASTTPIRSSAQEIFVPGSELEYNQIAARVMAEHRIEINDMHTFVRDQLDMQRPASGDPFSFEKIPLHDPLVSLIAHEIELRRGK